MEGGFNFNPDVFSDKDLLGFDQYITTLSGMIRDPKFKTPFCIGIYGKWGMGKTNFMRLLAKAVSEEPKQPYVIPVWFNPWRYQKEEHLIVPFLKTIEKAVQDYVEENKGIGKKVCEHLTKVAKRTGRVAVALAHGTTIKLGLMEIDVSKSAKREEDLNKKEQDENKALADELSSIYYNVVSQLEEYTDESMFRIAVFVDDLDRCLPEKAIELLESIKLFLDLEGYLFVIGVDKTVVEKGIAYHYRHLDFRRGEEKDGAPTVKAEDYLDKMIQFPLELPPIEPGCRKGYIQSLLCDYEECKKYAELIEIGVGDNPRTLKRFANLLAFISRHANTMKDGMMEDNSVSPEQKQLVKEYFDPVLYVKWSLIVFGFPEIHRMIKGKRHALIELQDMASGKSKEGEERILETVSIPDTLKQILKEGKQFPDDSQFLDMFVHLARATTLAVADTKTAATVLRKSSYQPGDMVLINKGSFLYGDEKREETIDYDYYMDVFPVTNQQYQEFINDPDNKDYPVPHVEESWAKPYRWGKKKRNFPKGKGNHPVVLVSYEDAVAFCKWRTKREGLGGDKGEFRLPAEKEWEKAARGNDGWVYPWGDDFDKEKCNTVESGIGGTTEVGKYPEGVSPFGCQDMAGNVWEWTDSWLDENEKKRKVLRGGSWNFYRENARCSFRFRYGPNYRYYTIYAVGFRCARVK